MESQIGPWLLLLLLLKTQILPHYKNSQERNSQIKKLTSLISAQTNLTQVCLRHGLIKIYVVQVLHKCHVYCKSVQKYKYLSVDSVELTSKMSLQSFPADKRVRKHYGSVFYEIHSLKGIYVKSSLSEIDVLTLQNAANRFKAKCDPHLPFFL